jgi:hypothetical protein
MCEGRGARCEGLKESTNYEVKSTVAARLLACSRGAIISYTCPAPLSFWRGAGGEACIEGRAPLDFARGPSTSHRMSTSAALGGRTCRPSEAEAMLLAELMVPERSRGPVPCAKDDVRRTKDEIKKYKLRSTVAARLLACSRGAIISYSCPAPLSFWRGAGGEACI